MNENGKSFAICERGTRAILEKVTGESACAVRVGLLPAGERSPREDEYAIDIDAGQGTIFASNPRSALLGVYAFFRKLGCRFLYPTEQGEELVQKSASQCSVHCRERASYCHRGITIEGCVSNKNVLDIIDWMPKIGFNSYFLQFPSANIFFRNGTTIGGTLFWKKGLLPAKNQNDIQKMPCESCKSEAWFTMP